MVNPLPLVAVTKSGSATPAALRSAVPFLSHKTCVLALFLLQSTHAHFFKKTEAKNILNSTAILFHNRAFTLKSACWINLICICLHSTAEVCTQSNKWTDRWQVFAFLFALTRAFSRVKRRLPNISVPWESILSQAKSNLRADRRRWLIAGTATSTSISS